MFVWMWCAFFPFFALFCCCCCGCVFIYMLLFCCFVFFFTSLCCVKHLKRVSAYPCPITIIIVLLIVFLTWLFIIFSFFLYFSLRGFTCPASRLGRGSFECMCLMPFCFFFLSIWTHLNYFAFSIVSNCQPRPDTDHCLIKNGSAGLTDIHGVSRLLN